VAIAQSFPGVQVIREPRQGVAHARSRGFDAAQSDIIARIDADTRLPDDWTSKVRKIFAEGSVAAVSGAIFYHDMAASDVEFAFDSRIRAWLGRKMRDRGFLLGSNMAIRRDAWSAVSDTLCAESAQHEDLDLAIHVSESGRPVVYESQLLTGVSGRRIDTDIVDFIRYLRSMPRTYTVHNASEARYVYLVAAFVLLNYLPLRILYRGYDSEQQAFRFRKLFGQHELRRVNPATYID